MKLNIRYILLMFFILCFSSPLVAFGREYSPENAFVFSFKENYSNLRNFETDNNVELDFMKLAINPILESIRGGQDHLRIVSYVGKGESNDTASLCDAFRNASLVRLYLSAKYEIPKSSYTFYVDTTASKSDMVSVELINSPAGEDEENSLYYTLNDSPAFYKTVIEMYDKIPYLRAEESFGQEYFVENILRQYSVLLRDAVNKQSKSDEVALKQDPSPMSVYLFEGGSGVLRDGKYMPKDSEYIVSSYSANTTATTQSNEFVYRPSAMQMSVSAPLTVCNPLPMPLTVAVPITVSVFVPAYSIVSMIRPASNSKLRPKSEIMTRTRLRKISL